MQETTRTRRRNNRLPMVAGALLTLALGVSHQAASAPTSADTVSPQSPQEAIAQQKEMKPKHHWYQVGRASWYGRRFQGHTTANGESYDMNALTCAHRELPLGSWVKVTNLRNKKWVIVRVNDRGPIYEDRIIDLSYAAAKDLNITGVTKVRLDLVTDWDPVMDKTVAELELPALPNRYRH
ncbi:MAG: septal ring lytic transglycosylase RlpA family protein [Acidobacteriaceae bacterium]